MKNPRILMVIPRFLPVVGGTEKQCWLLSKELARRGFRISVLTEREKGTPYFEELEGVKIYRLPGLKLPFFPSFGFFKTGSLFLLLNGFKYGLIHLHLVTSLVFPVLLTKIIFGKRIIAKFGAGGIYGDIETSRKSFLRRFKLLTARKYFDGFIAPSVSLKEDLEHLHFRNILFMPNAVDTDYFSISPSGERIELKKKLGFGEGKIFLFAGRFTAQKNLFFLLKAWKRFKLAPSSSRLVMIGEGEEKNGLQRFVRDRNIPDVSLLPPVPEERIREYYRASDFFVLPSHAEGISNALLEAVSSGLVPVVSDIPGNREIVENPGEDGFRFSQEREEDLTGLFVKCMELAENEVSKIRENQRNRIEKNYSIGKLADTYTRLFF
ncbi:MAG TPA: glycosyltransferase family 4 protein [bacterium]|nr:glycosyltransferase family 4 protein [bacterium]